MMVLKRRSLPSRALILTICLSLPCASQATTTNQATSTTVTVTAAADTSPPSVPTGLTASAVSSSPINLSWSPSTDNVGVTGYRIYRNGVQVATAPSASYSDTGLTPSTAYTYTVAAYDAAGNVSGQSGSASATTLPSSTVTTITLNPSVTYQTMSGWQANAQSGQTDCSGFSTYSASLFDQAVNDLGLNRIMVPIGVGFDLVNLDTQLNQIVLPLRQRMQLRGETPFIVLHFVGDGSSYVGNGMNTYAQGVLSVYQHMQSTFGFVPDAWDVANEPGFVSPNWTAQMLGDAVARSGALLQANGFTPHFIMPSLPGGAVNTLSWLDAAETAFPAAKPFIKEISYHRYYTVDPYLPAIAARAQADGINTAMLEHIGSGASDLHTDLKAGNNSAWQQFTLAYCAGGDNGGAYYYLPSQSSTALSMGVRTKYLRQYFKYIRKGAIRIDATTSNAAFDPVAFRNTSGKYVVVVKATSGGSFAISGLPSGTYGIYYTIGNNDATVTNYNVNLPDQTIATGQNITISVPATSYGIITVYDKTTGTVIDTTPPTTPTNLSASPISSSQINLSWSASTDPAVPGQTTTGVQGYRIYRCQGAGCTPSAQPALSPATSYQDGGLQASTVYTYAVSAYDAAGNASAPSASASATTPGPGQPANPPPNTAPPGAAGDLSSVRVYPNPWRSDQAQASPIVFDQFSGNATLKIFTVSGRLVKTLTTSSGQVTWGLTNDTGSHVASGMYLYLLTDDQGGRARGKLTVIR